MLKQKTIYSNEQDFEFTHKPIEDTITILKTKGGYKATYLVYDSSPDSSRNWDNFGTMLCSHGRYNLGDKQFKSSDYEGWAEIKTMLIEEKGAMAILPLYLYDHSGVTMKTTPFGCRWDSGQVGFIYATKEEIEKEYGEVSEGTYKKAIALLEGEVETYDCELTGEVYGCVVEHYNKKKEQIKEDSCWGYFGEKYALEELRTW